MASIYIDDEDEDDRKQNRIQKKRLQKRYKARKKASRKDRAMKEALSSHVSLDYKKKNLKARLDKETGREKEDRINKSYNKVDKVKGNKQEKNKVVEKQEKPKDNVNTIVAAIRTGKNPDEIETEDNTEDTLMFANDNQEGEIKGKETIESTKTTDFDSNVRVTPGQSTMGINPSGNSINLENRFNNLNNLNGKPLSKEEVTDRENTRDGQRDEEVQTKTDGSEAKEDFVQGEGIVPGVERKNGQVQGMGNNKTKDVNVSGNTSDNTNITPNIRMEQVGQEASQRDNQQLNGQSEQSITPGSRTKSTLDSTTTNSNSSTRMSGGGAQMNIVPPVAVQASASGGTESDEEDGQQSISERARNASTAAMLGHGINTGARKTARGIRGASRWVGKKFGFVKKIGLISSAIITIIWILLIIGVVSFIINMPGMVLDKLKMEATDFWDAITGYVTKNVVSMDLPTDTEVKNLALYLHDMGYDLEYMGFATKFSIEKKRVNELKTKYLPLYLAAEERSYLVENQGETWSLGSIWKGIKDVFAGEDWANISFGTGVLHIEDNAIKVLKIQEDSKGTDKATLPNRVKVYRREKELVINRNPNDDSTGSSTGNQGIDGYRFKLKYWLEKYTTPLDFYISLHVATRAPEFVASLTTDPTLGDGILKQNGNPRDTRIDINVAALLPERGDVTSEILYVDIDNETQKIKINPETNLPELLTVNEIEARLKSGQKVYGFTGDPNQDNVVLNAMRNFNQANLIVYTPYITKVINHWFYKEILFQGTSQSGGYAGEVDVYKFETLEKPIIRYQRYQAIQMGDENSGKRAETKTDSNTNKASTDSSAGKSDENQSGSSSGSSSGSGGSSSGNEGDSSGSGGDSSKQAEDTGIKTNFNEKGIGNDRKDIEEATKNVLSSEPSGSGGFWDSLINLISSARGFIGNMSGITGAILNMPSNILSSSFNSLGSLINGVMPTSILNDISNGWLGRLGSYSLGGSLNFGNLGSALNFSMINSELGIDKLSSMLNANSLINNLGLNEVQNMLAKAESLTNLNNLAGLAASAIDMPGLTTAFSDVAGMLKDGSINTDSLVKTLYDGAKGVLQGDELTQHVLDTSLQVFSGVRDGTAAKVAAGLIGGLATDLVDRTTDKLFQPIQDEIQKQLSGNFDFQIEKLLQNENSKSITGLTYNELEKVAATNADFNQVEKLNSELVTIKEKVDDTTILSRQLSDTVNSIAMDYAGVDAVTLYKLVKSIESVIGNDHEKGTFFMIEDTLDSLEEYVDSGHKIRNDYQIKGLIGTKENNEDKRVLGARDFISRIKDLIYKLDVSTPGTYTFVDDAGGTNTVTTCLLKEYSRKLYDMGDEIYYNIEHNAVSDTDITLMTKSTMIKSFVNEVGTTLIELDVDTINKYKKNNPDATWDDLKKLVDELVLLEPALNGMTDEIIKIGNKLEDVNEDNTNKLLTRLEGYNNNVDKIDWLTSYEKNKLKTQAEAVRTNTDATKQAILSSSLGLINNLSSNITGITTGKINTFANQIINLPNNTVNALLNTVKQVPKDVIKNVSQVFTTKLAEAVVSKTKSDLVARVQEGLKDSLDGKGLLTGAIRQGNGSAGQGEKISDDEDEPVEGMENEYLTGFYIKETRHRDYMQKSEPILVPYGFEHWKKAFITKRYLIAGTDTYAQLKKMIPDKNLFEDTAIVDQYGQSIWNASSGSIEEAIYAEISSSESADAQYLLRYFKELFTLYGKDLREAARKENQKISEKDQNVKHTIGWIFRTNDIVEIINTQTGQTRNARKSEYEPVNWPSANVGILYSKSNQSVYGFEPGIDIVAPEKALIVGKTEKKNNELGDSVTATITLQIISSDKYTNGTRVIIKGGDFSESVVGTTVIQNTRIGKTTNDNLLILVIDNNSHAQVEDVSQYIYPPYVTLNNFDIGLKPSAK